MRGKTPRNVAKSAAQRAAAHNDTLKLEKYAAESSSGRNCCRACEKVCRNPWTLCTTEPNSFLLPLSVHQKWMHVQKSVGSYATLQPTDISAFGSAERVFYLQSLISNSALNHLITLLFWIKPWTICNGTPWTVMLDIDQLV